MLTISSCFMPNGRNISLVLLSCVVCILPPVPPQRWTGGKRRSWSTSESDSAEGIIISVANVCSAPLSRRTQILTCNHSAPNQFLRILFVFFAASTVLESFAFPFYSSRSTTTSGFPQTCLSFNWYLRGCFFPWTRQTPRSPLSRRRCPWRLRSSRSISRSSGSASVAAVTWRCTTHLALSRSASRRRTLVAEAGRSSTPPAAPWSPPGAAR